MFAPWFSNNSSLEQHGDPRFACCLAAAAAQHATHGFFYD